MCCLVFCSVTCPDLNLFGLEQQPIHSLPSRHFYGNGSINVTCKPGFWSPRQTSPLTCTENGRWQPKPENCRPIICAVLNTTSFFFRQNTEKHSDGAILMEYKCKEGFQDVNNHGQGQTKTEKFCFVKGSIYTAFRDSCGRQPGSEGENDTNYPCLNNGSSTDIPPVCQGIHTSSSI